VIATVGVNARYIDSNAQRDTLYGLEEHAVPEYCSTPRSHRVPGREKRGWLAELGWAGKERPKWATSQRQHVAWGVGHMSLRTQRVLFDPSFPLQSTINTSPPTVSHLLSPIKAKSLSVVKHGWCPRMF